MEHFFTPVRSPSNRDEITPQKHHHQHQHHHQHPHHHRHHPYHQDAELQSDTGLDENDRNIDDSHGHHHHGQHHRHGYHPHEDHKHHDHHHHHHPHHVEEDEAHENHHTTVSISTASSSYFSSSSSLCSTSSWYTDASANDHGERCDGREPIVYANIIHEHPEGTYDHVHGRSQKMEKHVFNSLHRGHSRSDEGLENEPGGAHGGPQLEHGPLYKTASLSRSLAFSEESIVLGTSVGPKRAVSSSPLPGKGILKIKEPPPDIRKAKSLEVLSPRVAKGEGQHGEKGKGPPQMEMERAREDFVKGKLQFSAFLDEITKQVISPSSLNMLGVTTVKASGKSSAPASGQAAGRSKPQLSMEKHKESPGEESEDQPKQQTTQGKSAHSDPQSHTRKHGSAVKKPSGSPPPHPSGYRPHSGGNRRDRRSPPTEGPVTGDRYNRYGPHLTDGTSSSPELILPKRSDHRKQRPTASRSPPPHPHHLSHHQTHPDPPGLRHHVNSPPPPASAVRPGSEAPKSPKCKSDSSRTRDTASSATSQSSEHSDHHRAKVAHTGHPQQHRDTSCDHQLQVLQAENEDLHQNLIQTVVCIESLEAELQRTKEELRAVKEKYKSLLETHTGTRQANSLLGEHLHIASESLSSERKYLISRIAQLSSELEDANRTIAAMSMDNISVPCLIKQLLEKHFDSTEAIQKFLTTVTPVSHSAIVDNQSIPSKSEEMPHDVLKGSEEDQHRATAFIPWRHERGENCPSDLHKSSPSPPLSVTVNNADNPRPVHPQPCYQQTAYNHTESDTIPNRHHACSNRGSGMGEEHSAQLEAGPDGVALCLILDDLKQQLHPHKEKEVKGQAEGPA